MDLADLSGRVFGPGPLDVTRRVVSDFVEVTGDDVSRWADVAPPGFAAVALFVVAPDLLAELTDHSVVHGEQTFAWHRPMRVGETLAVTGTVTRVRERGGVNYVGFDVVATGESGTALEGSSLFLVTGESLPTDSGFERPEPAHGHTGNPGPQQRAASRADLVRYASATRDWNPIHWDHDAAVVAGLPGVVVHGLLQASWAFQAASANGGGPYPLRAGRVRFRNPLLPARPVDVAATVEGSEVAVSIADPDREYLSARIELSGE
jgi:acyl dehydratase